MSPISRSLTKLALPPKLAANIASFGCFLVSAQLNPLLIPAAFIVGQTTSAATLAGNNSLEADTSQLGQNSTASGSGLRENVRVAFLQIRTGECYAATEEIESESESDDQDRTLLDSASRLAHQFQEFGVHDLSPTHHSTPTTSIRHGRTRSRVHFERQRSPVSGTQHEGRGSNRGSRDRGVGDPGEPPRRSAPRTPRRDGQDGWVTVDDINNLAESINQGYKRIISIIQADSHGNRNGVDLHPDRESNSARPTRRVPPVGSTRSPFENELSVGFLYSLWSLNY
ncbi:hypothetical protein BJ322DRAFT_1017420 [Thelephora terrestris]|uniref:Uncharacterized protein n=1 Tax=Thelephora terrestris TaxID=56493 RepID=A0A9P6HMM6_9AGAM|nr:hypothetical protein BJ322DRAFT_1017420 [Thelephora terrestris]